MDDAATRYSRQIRLPEVGPEGQGRLAKASVLLVGVGGLGAPVALYLAGAGVGRLVLVDPDRVALSNLHRQVIYTTHDIGRWKVEAAADRLRALNPHVAVETHARSFDETCARDLVRGAEVVVDGTDVFTTRYLINDTCVAEGRPDVFASVSAFDGQVAVFTSDGPCYRCLYPEPPAASDVPSCDIAGVLGVTPGVVALMQANEVLKWILGTGSPLSGRLLLWDGRAATTRIWHVERDPACPACGHGSRPAPVAPRVFPEIDARHLEAWLCDDAPPEVLDVRTAEEYQAGALDSLLVPLNQLPWRLDDLAPMRDRPVVVVCRTGSRSAQAVLYLRENGFDAINLQGGLDAWRREVDPSLEVV